jgi:serine/threonine protein kinase
LIIPLPQPGTQVGAYTLLEKLGQGGSGHVFKAERGGRLYAVKVINTLTLGGWARREMTAMLRLTLEHVVQFKSFDRWPDAELGYPCIVMDYVPGLPLDVWALRDNPSTRAALTLFLKIVRALREVFRLGVLHRDIKESNILVREQDGEPVLIDFGFSAVQGALPETIPGMPPPGTPEYRSPEIMRFLKGETTLTYEYDLSDELWALGVTLYVLLTGELPFGERQELGLNGRILMDSPLAPHLRNPRIPEAASRLCLRMLEKDKQARFQDHDALCTALEELLAGAEGDASWDVPLRIPTPPAAEAADESDASPPDAPPPRVDEPDGERGPASPDAPSRLRRPSPLLVATLSLVALGVLFMSFWPRTATVLGAAAPPHTSTQAWETARVIPFREVASPGVPAQSDSGVAPLSDQPLAPSPAAMHPEPDTTRKPQQKPASPIRPTPPSKRKTAAGALALCAAAGGCTGAESRMRPTPEPIECPSGADQTHEQFDLGWSIDAKLKGYNGFVGEVGPTMREGPISVVLDKTWEKLPSGTEFMGTLVFGKNRFFGLFTQARTPDRKTYPVCVQIHRPVYSDACTREGLGECPEEGSRPGAFVIPTRVDIKLARRNHFEFE